MDPGILSAYITVIFLVSVGAIAVILTIMSRRRIERREAEAEEGKIPTKSIQVESEIPKVPVLNTKASPRTLSALPVSKKPSTPERPGIRFTIMAPSYRDGGDTGMKGSPNMETVPEGAEQEERSVRSGQTLAGAKYCVASIRPEHCIYTEANADRRGCE